MKMMRKINNKMKYQKIKKLTQMNNNNKNNNKNKIALAILIVILQMLII